jgi:dinuclear metal center YbgI/SA1388 family protein
MNLREIDQYLRDLLSIDEMHAADASLNGIQCACSEKDIQRAAFAVDACMQSIERAASLRADLLFVHHGLFWGKPIALTGSHYDRVKLLMDSDMALYAAHLPLDRHPRYGNNAGIAAAIGLEDLQPFGKYRGIFIGVKGTLPSPLSVDEILMRMGTNRSQCVSVLAFGKERCATVGIVSGGATSDVEQAVAEALDLYITGDAGHTVYHTCLEERINMVCAGHYDTEVWGVRLVADKLAQDTSIETVFVDVPTGL